MKLLNQSNKVLIMGGVKIAPGQSAKIDNQRVSDLTAHVPFVKNWFQDGLLIEIKDPIRAVKKAGRK